MRSMVRTENSRKGTRDVQLSTEWWASVNTRMMKPWGRTEENPLANLDDLHMKKCQRKATKRTSAWEGDKPHQEGRRGITRDAHHRDMNGHPRNKEGVITTVFGVHVLRDMYACDIRGISIVINHSCLWHSYWTVEISCPENNTPGNSDLLRCRPQSYSGLRDMKKNDVPIAQEKVFCEIWDKIFPLMFNRPVRLCRAAARILPMLVSPKLDTDILLFVLLQ